VSLSAYTLHYKESFAYDPILISYSLASWLDITSWLITQVSTSHLRRVANLLRSTYSFVRSFRWDSLCLFLVTPTTYYKLVATSKKTFNFLHAFLGLPAQKAFSLVIHRGNSIKSLDLVHLENLLTVNHFRLVVYFSRYPPALRIDDQSLP